MAITVNINGTTFSYPEVDDVDYWDDATDAFEALANPANTLYVNSVVDDLLSFDTAVPLSANQGRVLKSFNDAQQVEIDAAQVDIIDLEDEVNSSLTNMIIDGDFNHNQLGLITNPTGSEEYIIDNWLVAGEALKWTYENTATTVSKRHYLKYDSAVSTFAHISTPVPGNPFSGKTISFFLELKSSNAPTALKIQVNADSTTNQGESAAITGITASYAWYRVDLVVASHATAVYDEVKIQNDVSEAFQLDINKIRAIETPALLTAGEIPDWIKQDEVPNETIELVNYNIVDPFYGSAPNAPYEKDSHTHAGISGTSIQNNYSAVIDPTVDDDSGEGYAVGSRWVNTVLDISFTLTDATIGAAVWEANSGGGVSFASGIIKDSTSVVNDSTLSSISDWAGADGAWTSTVTLNDALAYEYAISMVFYKLVGSDYVQITPSEVRVTSTTTILITEPVDTDLYLGQL